MKKDTVKVYMYGLGAASRLINIMEKSIIENAKQKTEWWQDFEKKVIRF